MDGAAVIRGLELEVAPGEIIALLGANGAGKTTTLRTVSGLVHPLEGTLRPAREVLEALVTTVRPVLEQTGDLERVTEGVARVLAESGASRQRAAYERIGELSGVVLDLVARTEPDDAE